MAIASSPWLRPGGPPLKKLRPSLISTLPVPSARQHIDDVLATFAPGYCLHWICTTRARPGHYCGGGWRSQHCVALAICCKQTNHVAGELAAPANLLVDHFELRRKTCRRRLALTITLPQSDVVVRSRLRRPTGKCGQPTDGCLATRVGAFAI